MGHLGWWRHGWWRLGRWLLPRGWCQGAVLNGQGKWNEAIAILRRGQAILQRDGSAQEQSLAAALTEQLETAQLALANAR